MTTKIKILIIDDSKSMRDMLSDLSQIVIPRAEICVAVDGYDGITKFTKALFDEKPYNIIFCDIAMPNINGINTVAAIRAMEDGCLTERSNIIITTSDNSDDTHKALFRYEIEKYLTKPVTLEAIEEELKCLVEKLH